MSDLVVSIGCGCLAGAYYWIFLDKIQSEVHRLAAGKTELAFWLFGGSFFAQGSAFFLAEFLSAGFVRSAVASLMGVLIVFSLVCLKSGLIILTTDVGGRPQMGLRFRSCLQKPRYPVKRKNDWP